MSLSSPPEPAQSDAQRTRKNFETFRGQKNVCIEERKASLACLSNAKGNNHLCQRFFDAYNKCKGEHNRKKAELRRIMYDEERQMLYDTFLPKSVQDAFGLGKDTKNDDAPDK